MRVHHRATAQSRWLICVCLVVATLLIAPTQAQAQDSAQPVTATIILGSHEGAAHPTRQGFATTGGGNINISQPAPDTLMVTMSGNVAAASSAFKSAEAAIDFYEQIHFQVEFSQPGHTGNLIIQAKINGLLNGRGKNAVVGMVGATASVSCGPNGIATLPLSQRIVTGCDSLAVNAAHGPVCVPIFAGCFSLDQQFRIAASQAAGGLSCGKASAEFSPSELPSTWTGQSYPFKNVDKSDLGYQVILRVVPSTPTPLADSNPIDVPPTAQNNLPNLSAFPAPPLQSR